MPCPMRYGALMFITLLYFLFCGRFMIVAEAARNDAHNEMRYAAQRLSASESPSHSGSVLRLQSQRDSLAASDRLADTESSTDDFLAFPTERVRGEHAEAMNTWHQRFTEYQLFSGNASTSIPCSLCQSAFRPYHAIAICDQSAVVFIAKLVCKTLHLQDPQVCDGAIERFAPVLLTSLTNRFLDAAGICQSFHLCPRQEPPVPSHIVNTLEPGENSRSSGNPEQESYFAGRRIMRTKEAERGETTLRANLAAFEVSAKGQDDADGSFRITGTVGSPTVHKTGVLEEEGSGGDEPEVPVGSDEGRPEQVQYGDEGFEPMARPAPGESLEKGGDKAAEQTPRGQETVLDEGMSKGSKERRAVDWEEETRKMERDTFGGESRKELQGAMKGNTSRVGYFLHFGDIHLDVNYTPGSDTECGRPICCQQSDGEGPTPARQAHRIGEFTCDTSLTLLDGVLDFIRSPGNLPPLDFVIYSGDTAPHTIWKDTVQSTSSVMITFYAKLKTAFGAVPVYPCLGNHGVVPADQLPPPPARTFLSTLLWEVWKAWLPDSCQETVSRGGFYTTLHQPGLRILALNSQWYDVNNFWLLNSSTLEDPAGQLAWMEATLIEAERNEERVIVLGHIPVGDTGCYEYYARRVLRLFVRFKATVMVSLFGHTHNDHFKLFSGADKEGGEQEDVGVALMAPSFTPLDGHNPTFRLVSYSRPPPLRPSGKSDPDPRSWGESWRATEVSLQAGYEPASLLDYWQYILDLQEAKDKDDPRNWVVQYRASKEYEMASMALSEWRRLAQRLATDSSLFERFLGNFHDLLPQPCNEQCRRSKLAYLTSSSFFDFQRQRGNLVENVGVLLAVLFNKIVGRV
eukprot:TRINITY_DN5478_c0_g1_i1.p1 TRINITY_DN5478_c0_g1~~TRINITY_DN5478_c0_g1_i1.p1  ORF type:complete len:856 (-),score=107.60 TRINITY_DN5478_c0_g1_i1:264-2831(-)